MNYRISLHSERRKIIELKFCLYGRFIESFFFNKTSFGIYKYIPTSAFLYLFIYLFIKYRTNILFFIFFLTFTLNLNL